MSGLDNEQRRIIDAMFERRLKPARHEVSDHLDRTLPPIKVKPGTDGDVLCTVSNDVEWQNFEEKFLKKDIGKIYDFAGTELTVPENHWSCDGRSLTRSLYPTLFDVINPILSSVATATASNDRITISTGHGLIVGDRLFIESIESGGTGLSTNTEYYVNTVVDSNNITVGTGRSVNASTGAVTVSGGPVNITADGTGIIVRHSPWGIAASTSFKLPDLRQLVTVGLPSMGESGTRTTYSSFWNSVTGLDAGAAVHLLTGAQSGTSVHGHGNNITYGNPTHNITASITDGTAIITNGQTLNTTNTGTSVRFTNSSRSSAVTISGSVTQGTKTGGVTDSVAANASDSHNNMQPGALVYKIIYSGPEGI